MCDPQLRLVPMPNATTISWVGSPATRIDPPLHILAGGFVAFLTNDGGRQLAAYGPDGQLLECRDVPVEATVFHDRVTFIQSLT